MSFKSIAIDGPSGAGKSTLAKMVAERLGYLYVDTGAIYRTVGLFVKQKGADPSDAQAVTDLLREIHIEIHHGADGLQHMVLNGKDVTEDIRQHEISGYASQVSAHPQVREFLLNMQRDLARRGNVVMDGRDIGTVVLPQADVKIFLTADPKDRARRRYEELVARGQHTDFDTVLADLLARDEHDSTRSAAPLRQAEGALRLDTTGNTLEQSFQVLLKTIKEQLGE